MDEINPQSSRLNRPASSIPRPSKLPLPRAAGSGIPRPGAGNTALQPPRTLSGLRPVKSSNISSGKSTGLASFSKSVNGAYGSRGSAQNVDEDVLFQEPNGRPLSKDSALTSSTVFDPLDTFEPPVQETSLPIGPTKRKPRPSLSERTTETLSQIPPSPRPGSRPASAMSNHGRPPSSSGSRPASPSKNFVVPPVPRLPTTYKGQQTERSGISSTGSRAANTTSKVLPTRNGPSTTSSPSRAKLPTRPTTTSSPSTLKSRTVTGQSVKKTTTPSKLAAGKASSQASKDIPQDATSNGSKSSSTLRETIAAAKAAAAARNKSAPSGISSNASISNGGGPSSDFGGFGGFDDISDSFDDTPRSLEGNLGLLRKRIQMGRSSGSLNIAALGLKQIPDDVMKMYDFDPNSNSNWAEAVDLTKLIAADNEIVELREDAFPDISVEELADAEEDINFQFGGLETMDLHGNLLQTIPLGFRRLERLYSLNLANNNLPDSCLEIISTIPGLKELNLSSNKLTVLMTDISKLDSLQTLNLRSNQITELPDSIEALTQLRKLDVASNMLQAIPMYALAKAPLTELNVSHNKLTGSFFDNSSTLSRLVSLDISNNQLDKISEDSTLSIATLQILRADANRLTALPDLSSCPGLLTLTVSQNKLTAFPENLQSIGKLRTFDVSQNSISKIEPRIAFMEHLTSLRLEGNTLRERKYLTMGTADLKEDLRRRFETQVQDSNDTNSDSVAAAVGAATASSSGIEIKAGVLDLSSKRLAKFDIKTLPAGAEIKEARLQRNSFTSLPMQLLTFSAESLKVLDLSHNPLASSFIEEPISLPLLTVLNLSSTGLKTLEPLLELVDAPCLRELDISVNRLQGTLPELRSRYTQLTILNASDNQFSTLPPASAAGLTSLNLQNNALTALEPRLGLMKELKLLEVRGNVFRVPRWDVLDKGTAELMKWLLARIPDDQRPSEMEEVETF